MNLNFKKNILPHIISTLIIFILSVFLFNPILDGARLMGPDSASGVARYKHIQDYGRATGEMAYWNPSQFSGDPRVMNIGKENNFLSIFHKIITLNKEYPIGMFFAFGWIMYLSLSLLRVSSKISLIVSLAYMLSYIFFLLYEAGHGSKNMTLIYSPLIISGLIMLLGKDKVRGVLALLIGVSLSIYTGHIQMVFYLIIALVGFGIPLIVFAFIEKSEKSFFVGLGMSIIIALIGAGTDYSQIQSSLDYSNQTMRGGKILIEQNDKKTDDAKAKTGLDWDYAMNWSYEPKELLVVISPRFVGGGSQEKVSKDNPLAKLMMQNGREVKNGKVRVPGYWGNMPFTSGGAYLGAGIFFLFILSLFFVKKKYAYAFGSAIIIIFLLSLGKNAEWFNRILFDHLPMFDKFRAPSSASSILPAFVFLLAGMGLNEMLKVKDKEVLVKKILIISGSFIGFILLSLVFGLSNFNFLSTNDFKYDVSVQNIFMDGRKELFKQDILRSLLIIVSLGILIILYFKNRLKSKQVFLFVIAAILIIDLYPVDKRIVSKEDYTSKIEFERMFAPREVDLQIQNLEKNGRAYYRVLDLSVKTFNDSKSCYYHNQVGGYSAIKTQRYQDIIQRQIAKNNMEVLNMLNTKYFITKNGQVQTNLDANGTAWFVKNIKFVETDLAEIESLNEINTKKTAIIKKSEFEEVNYGDGTGNIDLIAFTPNKMTYRSKSKSNQLAIFSETWHGGKGWTATIDGEEIPIIRTNYILRGLEVPSGEHTVIMEFKPVASGVSVSIIASILGLLLVILAILINLGIIDKENSLKRIFN